MRSAISSPVGPGDVPVEDGDVVGVDAQQLERGVAVAGDVGRDRLQAQAVADGLRHVGLVLDDQHTHAPMLEPARFVGISKTGYVPATARPHGADSQARPTGGRRSCRRPAGFVAAIAAARRPRPGGGARPPTPPTAARGIGGRAEPGVAGGRQAASSGRDGPGSRPARTSARLAIASVAKVMTAYLVLRDHPLRPGEDGPTITLTEADAADTDRRRGQHESVVSSPTASS